MCKHIPKKSQMRLKYTVKSPKILLSTISKIVMNRGTERERRIPYVQSSSLSQKIFKKCVYLGIITKTTFFEQKVTSSVTRDAFRGSTEMPLTIIK